MKPIRIFAALAILPLAALARADDAPASGTIDASNSAAINAAKDTTATVQGKVASAEWSKTGAVCTIEFDNAPGFMAAAFAKNKDKLNAAFGGDFTKTVVGATIKITGKLAPYGGHADKYKDAMQILVKNTSQITVVTPASDATTQPAR